MAKRIKAKDTFWVVNHRDGHDDDFFLFSCLSMLGRTKQEAWIKFLTLVDSDDRKTWNKRGYVATKVVIKATISGG